MPITRLALDGYGAKRTGTFAGKEASAGGGPHPVGILTRLTLDAYGGKRAGNFGGKQASGAAIKARPPLTRLHTSQMLH